MALAFEDPTRMTDMSDAMAKMGITRFSETSQFDNVKATLNDPEEYLRKVPNTRDTIVTPIMS